MCQDVPSVDDLSGHFCYHFSFFSTWVANWCRWPTPFSCQSCNVNIVARIPRGSESFNISLSLHDSEAFLHAQRRVWIDVSASFAGNEMKREL